MIKYLWIICLLYCIALLMISCVSSPMINLQTARINKNWHVAGAYQMRSIKNNGGLFPKDLVEGVPGYGEKYSTYANAGLVRFGYGWKNTKTGWEAGLRIGAYERFYWDFPLENNSINYFPSTLIAFESNPFYLNPYLKFGFNQNNRLKFALVGEAVSASGIASYDFTKITPYASIKLAVTKYENPYYEWREYYYGPDNTLYGRFYTLRELKYKKAIVTSVGCEFNVSSSHKIIVEGGIAPHYFRNDNLFIFGLGYNID